MFAANASQIRARVAQVPFNDALGGRAATMTNRDLQGPWLKLLGARDEIRSCQAKAAGKPVQAAVARVALTGLHVGEPPLMQAGVVRELLLRQAKLFPASPGRKSEGMLRRSRRRHARRLAFVRDGRNDIRVDIEAKLR